MKPPDTIQNAYDASNLGKVKPKVLIGGKSGKFVPNLNMSFELESGSEQYFINVNRKSVTVGSQVQEVVDNKVKLKVGDNTDIWHVDDNGRLKWDIQFDTKPSGNVFEWELKCSNELEFCYQPALTEAEIAKGTVRPPEVVGSYAVYCGKTGHHKDKDGNTIVNYATGKLTHIYRPFCTDAAGKTAWADLYINPDDKLLRITIPQDYLDSAVYPVTLDPTFGYTTIGATNGSSSTGCWWALDALSSAGTLTNLSIACDTAGGSAQNDIRYAFYSDNSGVPNTLLVSDATAWTIPAGSTKTWRTNPVAWSYSLAASTQYWGAAFGASIPPGYAFAYDTGGSKTNRYTSATTPPSPAGTTTQDYTSAHFSVYATYTSGGSTYTDSVAESASASDSPDRTLTTASSQTESGSAASTQTAVSTLKPSLAESASASDSPSAIATIGVSQSEATNATDLPAGSITTAGTLTEANSGVDVVNATRLLPTAIVESGSANDSFTNILGSSVAEAGSGTDSPSAIATVASGLTESCAASASASSVVTAVSSVQETSTASDAITTGVAASQTETANAIDSNSAISTQASVVTETASANESVSGIATIGVSRVEASSAADIPSAISTVLAAVVETSNASETIDTGLSTHVTEAISASDNVSGLVTVGSQVAETCSVTDAYYTGIGATQAENASALDNVTAVSTRLDSISENSNAQDAPISTTTIGSGLTEPASATDTLEAQSSTASVSESTSAQDSLTAIIQVLGTLLEPNSCIDQPSVVWMTSAGVTEPASALDLLEATMALPTIPLGQGFLMSPEHRGLSLPKKAKGFII